MRFIFYFSILSSAGVYVLRIYWHARREVQNEEKITWCFTPSQPVRLDQGEGKTYSQKEEEEDRKKKK